MIINVDDEDILTLSAVQENVIKNDIPEARFNSDMNRRVIYFSKRLYTVYMKTLKQKWEDRIRERVTFMPDTDDEYAALIFAQPDYVSFWDYYQLENPDEDLSAVLPAYDNSQATVVKIDGAEVATITPLQKQVMEAWMWPHTLNDKIKTMIKSGISEKYLQCYKRLKHRWDAPLRSRGHRIPADRDAYASLVFAQPDYQSRSQREAP